MDSERRVEYVEGGVVWLVPESVVDPNVSPEERMRRFREALLAKRIEVKKEGER